MEYINLMTDVEEIIDTYHNNDYWLVPTKDKVSKSRNNKSKQLDRSLLLSIFKNNKCNGFGIITPEDVPYLSFDVDVKDATYGTRLAVRLNNELKFLKNKFNLSTTPSGGYHLYVLFRNLEERQQFIGTQAYSTTGKAIVTGRAPGQYCCEYPTPGYKWLVYKDIKPLNDKDLIILREIFDNLNENKGMEYKKTIELLKAKYLNLQSKVNSNNNNTNFDVRDDFNAKMNIEDVLINHNYTFVYTKDNRAYYLRPGGSSNQSGFVENNLYVNFSDNAGLPERAAGGHGRKFTAFDLVLHWEYNNNYSECVKALMQKGYCVQQKTMSREKIVANKMELYHKELDGIYNNIPTTSYTVVDRRYNALLSLGFTNDKAYELCKTYVQPYKWEELVNKLYIDFKSHPDNDIQMIDLQEYVDLANLLNGKTADEIVTIVYNNRNKYKALYKEFNLEDAYFTFIKQCFEMTSLYKDGEEIWHVQPISIIDEKVIDTIEEVTDGHFRKGLRLLRTLLQFRTIV